MIVSCCACNTSASACSCKDRGADQLTIVAKVDNAAAQQNDDLVEEVEGLR